MIPAAFFFFAFVVTWTAWLLPYWLGSTRGLLAPGGPVFLLGVFAPGLVALALVATTRGREGVWRLLARIARADVPVRWYVFALVYMAASKMAAAAVHRLVAGAWPPFGETPWFLLFLAIPFSMWVQAGEEVGWRGYALPVMARRLGLGGASILLGLIWASWHLPLFFIPGTGSDGQSFPLYLSHVTALSVAMAWLYWKTGGSLLLAMIMHAAVNNTTGIVPAAVPGASDPLSVSGSLVGWTTVALAWLVAIPLLYQMRGAEVGALLDEEPPPRAPDPRA